MALTENIGTTLRAKFGFVQAYPVKGGVHIFRGATIAVALAGASAGYALPAINEAADVSKLLVVGIAWEEIDATDTANGAKIVRVRSDLKIVRKKASAVAGDVGKLAVVVDDEAVSLPQVAGANSNVVVGRISELRDSASVYVDLLDHPYRALVVDADALYK
jgi:hypothetical protein